MNLSVQECLRVKCTY